MMKKPLSRRHFMKLLAALFSSIPLLGSAVPAAENQTRTSVTKKQPVTNPKIGIALGAGGANGLAHILLLEVLDEMKITPYCIAGSSIGSIIGALYAAGMSGRQIRQLVEQFIITPDERLQEELVNKDTLRWLEFIEVELGHGGILSSEGFIAYLYDALQHDAFEKLKMPLKIVAADLWQREQVIFEKGSLLPAIKASMAIPGVFEPVTYQDRVLVDGGTVNPVPYDLLTAECDIVIGIDVSGQRSKSDSAMPSYFETIFNSIKVMQQAIMLEKLRWNKPDIYIVPQIVDVHALEFYRAESVFQQARSAKEELKQQLLLALKT